VENFRNMPTPCVLASRIAILALSALLTFTGCERTKVDPGTNWQHASLRDVDDASWQRLAARKIYFGHQSVGMDVINGIRDLEQQHPQVRLNIVRNSNPSTVAGPAFVESLIGKNGDPGSKTAAFRAVLDQGMGAQGGIAMYKYCFVDVSADTDVSKMFHEYKAAAAAVHAKYPGLTVVHITMPLTTVEGSVKALAKSALGKPTQRDLEVKRNQFNDLLRKEYGGKQPIFDLAAVESTRRDGSRVFFQHDGSTVYTLAPEFTNDGAHLNEIGRQAVAEQLLIALARL